MIEEYKPVVLTADLPEFQLKAGDVGLVAMAHGKEAFEVEFVTLDGDTVALVTLSTDQVRPIAPGETPHLRALVEAQDEIALTVDLPRHGLEAGDLGKVVEVLGDGYLVEFSP